jgi:hypothetical protein
MILYHVMINGIDMLYLSLSTTIFLNVFSCGALSSCFFFSSFFFPPFFWAVFFPHVPCVIFCFFAFFVLDFRRGSPSSHWAPALFPSSFLAGLYYDLVSYTTTSVYNVYRISFILNLSD